jgi:hypothetical protein
VYMTTSKEGERAELWQLRGFGATNIKDAFRDVQIMAGATKCEQPFFHVQVRNREGETLTRQQWEITADRIERMLGLSGQPRAISFHTYEHNDDEHMHVAWSRIDENTLSAKALPYFKFRLKTISRELEAHFALEPVVNHRKGKIKFAPTRAEVEQARRLGQDSNELRNTIRECWDRADCGRSFQAALEHEGMTLAQGERRDFVVIDRAGGLHVLGKRILDMTAAKIRDRLADLSRDDMPTVGMVRAMIEPEQERTKQHQPEKREQEWDRDRADRDWQNAVMNAAIDREKVEREFVEPEERSERAGAGSRKKEKSVQPERPLNDAAAAIRLAYSLSRTPEEFLRNLDQAGFRMARATREEAELSQRNATFAKEVGRFTQQFREGEYVAINERGHTHSLNQRTTGESREDLTAYMRTVSDTKFQSIQDTQKEIATFKRPAQTRKHWQSSNPTTWQKFGGAARELGQRDEAPEDRRGPSAEIWTAYKRSDNARAFVKALEERGFTVAVVTHDDVRNSRIDQHYSTSLAALLPKKLREVDYVAVASNGRAYNLNRHTTGESGDRVQKFMTTLDPKEFKSVYATLEIVQERGALRDIERQAFRDIGDGKRKGEKDTRPIGRLGRKARVKSSDKFKGMTGASKATTRTVGKTLDVFSDAFASLFAPTLTPEQILQGEKAADRREADADRTIDFARYTSDVAQQRQQLENEREAERQRLRERDGRDR